MLDLKYLEGGRLYIKDKEENFNMQKNADSMVTRDLRIPEKNEEMTD